MNGDILVIYLVVLKVVKYFFPAVVFIVFGLAYIAYDERRDKQSKKKRTYRQIGSKR